MGWGGYGVCGVCACVCLWAWCAARCERGSVAVYLLAAVREVTLWWMVQSNQGWAVTGCTQPSACQTAQSHTHTHTHRGAHTNAHNMHAYIYLYTQTCVFCFFYTFECRNTTSYNPPMSRGTMSSHSLHLKSFCLSHALLCYGIGSFITFYWHKDDGTCTSRDEWKG